MVKPTDRSTKQILEIKLFILSTKTIDMFYSNRLGNTSTYYFSKKTILSALWIKIKRSTLIKIIDIAINLHIRILKMNQPTYQQQIQEIDQHHH